MEGDGTEAKNWSKPLTAPFPYCGGKSQVADIVWQALGDPAHYLEPFFGSGAVLLARPGYNPTRHVETVCDADGLLCNVWRGIQFAPDEVAKWCDWPVNHADLMARRRVLIREKNGLLDKLVADDTYFDAKLAGYWIWSASSWIGARLTCINAMPHVSSSGHGVHKISLRNSSHGRLGDPYVPAIYDWLRALSERLRHVRVVCGDWTRVCGGNWQTNMGTCGIFFDPPYGVDDRHDVYVVDSKEVADKVREWALKRGYSPEYRIVIAGYEEHMELIKHGWTVYRWKANGGFANIGNSQRKRNRFREHLYMSPHCVQTMHPGLFDDATLP